MRKGGRLGHRNSLSQLRSPPPPPAPTLVLTSHSLPWAVLARDPGAQDTASVPPKAWDRHQGSPDTGEEAGASSVSALTADHWRLHPRPLEGGQRRGQQL